MKNTLLTLAFSIASIGATVAQTNPIITEWLQNTTGITGRHYVEGNSTPIDDAVEANVQSVDYSDDWVYVSATGIPAYITGPFLDGNPSLATDQGSIFKFPLVPTENVGTPTETSLGNIGVFINGVALFDWKDGISWNNETGNLCGGPGYDMCPGGPMATQDWNRDAVPAEMAGFDCAKAHPAMGNYHHHQNPSAFNLDLVVISDICDTYPSDGLYVIDSNSHSPLIGFAYDGFPIYGAYGYANADGTGGITRMKSSYAIDATATTRLNGPDIDETVETQTFFNGYFKEDYIYTANTSEDYLDEHNGRFSVTPEYPDGIYCYYATVDENHNSIYPYAVGPTFYGNVVAENVTTISESTTNYVLAINDFDEARLDLIIYPNPAQDFFAIQSNLQETNLKVELTNELGQLIKTSEILQGSTLAIIETHTLYNGIYFVKVSGKNSSKSYKIIINK
ncbi:putative orphan protein [unidentified eubacterium SCB49]|nr:putative orphan protein [unidentified eubacterium SCB49]